VAAANGGDRRALDALLRRHIDRIHALCRRILGNDADAADATQEALIAVVRGLPRFDGRSAFSTWSYRVATNACLDEARRRSRRAGVLADEALEGAAASSPVSRAPDVFDRIGDRIDIDAALATLSPEFRTAVVLRDVMGLDYAEIADILDVPPGTVRSRIARGRAGVAAVLGNPPSPTKRPRT